MFGWITMRAGCAAVTVPSGGSVLIQFLPSSVTLAEWNVTGVVLRLCTSTVCDPGDSPSTGRGEDQADGCTIGPRLLPGASTFRKTDTDCGVLSASGALTCTVPAYVPGLQIQRVHVQPNCGHQR